MKSNLRFSLKFKFIGTITLVVVFTAIILSSFFVYSQKVSLRGALEKRTEDIAKRLSNSTDLYMGDRAILEFSVGNTLLEDDVIYAIIYDRDASIIAEAGTTDVDVREFLFHNKPDRTDPLLFNKKEPRKNIYKTKNHGEIFEVLIPMVYYDLGRLGVGVSLANDNIRDDEIEEIIGIVRVGVQ